MGLSRTIAAAALAVLVALTAGGCGGGGQNGVRAQSAAVDESHDNAWFDINAAFGEQLADGLLVKAALVATTDRNIYVAARTAESLMTDEADSGVFFPNGTDSGIAALRRSTMLPELLAAKARTIAGSRVRHIYVTVDPQCYTALEQMGAELRQGHEVTLARFNEEMKRRFGTPLPSPPASQP